MTKTQNKILIVGAGPAGIATALFLAKKGISCVLLEKEFFPRDKICGDGLSGWVISMLHKLDMGLVEELAEHPGALDSWGITFYAPNLKQLTLPYVNKNRPDEAPGYVIRRKVFDELLLKKVREHLLIELLEGVHIRNFKESEQGVEVSDDTGKVYQGDLVVFADGAGSVFSKDPGGILREDQHYATGIKCYYSGLKKAKGKGQKDQVLNPVEFYFLKEVLPGYLWIFPLPNGEANVGLGIRTDVMKKKKIQLKSVMLEAIKSNPLLQERFEGAQMTGPVQAWGLPLGSKKRPISGSRFLLAGDAASLIDPFTGEGVGNALNMGFHAAEHIEACIQQQRFDADFNKKYDQRVYNKLWKELRISTLIQKLIVRPGLFTWVINRTIGNSYLKASFVKMIDDLEERKRLGRPGFYLRVLWSGFKKRD